jgi:nicotinamide mononucleotide transporter
VQTLLSLLQPLFAPAFTAWGAPFTWIEIVAFALSIWMVVCNMRVQPIAWPLAMAASLLYALLFADGRLYGEAGLQLFFVAMAGWGWWQWLRGQDATGHVLVVRPLAPRIGWRVAIATAAAYPVLVEILARIDDASPRLDALPTVGSIAGQYLLGRKYIENWPTWLAVNVVSVVLFVARGLWLTVLLYVVFAVLSVAGWRAWGQLRGQRSAQAARAAVSPAA